MENLHIPITGDSSNFRSALQSARDGVRQTAKQIEDSGMTIEQMFDRIKVAAAASLAGFSVKEFASKVMEVRGEFQKLEVAFTTMLGSAEKADALMQQLVKTAAITPFDLKGVADGAKQLMAYGIAADEVNDTLIHLGDIAAGLSLPLGDLVYLYGTTMTQGRMFTQDLRQFMGRGIPLAEELAKQFGVTKDKVGELVTAGKVGAEEFKKAIMSMSSDGGRFGGLMEEQSKTITGQISNIEDAIDVMFNNIGKQSDGIINGALSAISSLVENYETVGRVIMGLVVTYGVYKTAVMTVTALESFRTKNLALQAVGVQGVTAAEAIHYHWLVLVQKAQALLNATMLANPYVAVATAVAAVTAALISLGSEQDRVNAAYDEYMRKRDEAIAKEEEHRRKIEQLIQIAGDESLSTDTRRKALLKLEEKYPDIFKKYATEIEMLKHIRDIKAEIAILDGKTSITNPANELAEIDKRIAELQKKGAWSLSSTNSYAGTHSSSRTRSEEEELQQKLRRRRELAKEIERDRGEAYLTNLTGVSNGSLQLQINERRKLLKEIEAQEKLVKEGVTVTGRIKLGGATGVYNKQEIQAQLQTLKREQERRAQIIADGSKNFVAEARKAYREQEKELKKLRALTDPKKRAESDITIEIGGKMVKVSDMSLDQFSDAIKKQQAKVDEAEKKLKTLTGKSANKAAEEANMLAQQGAKYTEEARKQQLVRERAAKDLELSTRQAEIDAMKESSEKTVKQLTLDFEKRREDIERGYEDLKQQKIEAAKKLWEANPSNKGKVFDASTVDTTYSTEEMENRQKQLDAAFAAYVKLLNREEQANRDAINAYLKQYGDYAQKKQAINESANDHICELEEQLLDDMTSEARQAIEARIALIHKETDAQIEELDQQYGKAKQFMIDLFGDASKKSVAEIEKIIKKYEELEKFLQGDSTVTRKDLVSLGFTNKELDQALDKLSQGKITVKDYTDALKNMRGELAERSPWQKFKKDIGDAVDMLKAANGDNTKIGTAITNIGKACSDYMPEVERFSSAIYNLFGVDDKGARSAISAMQGLSKAAEGVGQIVSGQWMDGVVNAVDGVSQAFNGLADMIDDIGSRRDSDAEFNKIELKAIRKAVDKIVDKFEGDSMSDAIRDYEDAIRLYTDALERAQQNVQDAFSKSSSNIAGRYNHRSINYYMNEIGSKEDIQKINDLLGVNLDSFSELWFLSPDQLEEVKEKLPQVFSIIEKGIEKMSENASASSDDEDARAMLEAYMELVGKKKEIEDAFTLKMTGTTVTSVKNDFKNMLSDMTSDAETFSEHFEEMIRNSVINALMSDKYNAALEGWYQLFSSYYQNDSKLGEDEIADLRERYKQISDEAIAERDALVNAMADAEETMASSFDSLRSSFRSTLLDMKGDTREWGKNIAQIMTEALVDRFVLGEDFDKWLNEWAKSYESIANATFKNKNDGTFLSTKPEEIEAEKARLQEIVDMWGWLADRPIEMMTRDAIMLEHREEAIAALEALAKLDEYETYTEEERAAAIAELNNQLQKEMDLRKQMAKVYADMTGWTLWQKIDASPLANIGDELISALQDTSKGVEDWKKEIVDSLTNDLIKQIVYNDSFKEQIQALQERYVALFEPDEESNKLTPEQIAAEIEKIASELAGMMTEAEKQVEGIKTIIPDIDTSPFENVRDTFLDTLTDIEGDVEKFKENLVKILTKDLIERLVLDVPLTLDVTRRGEDGTIGKIGGKAYDNFNAYSDDWNKAYLDGMKELQEAQKALNEARASGDEEAIAAAEAHYNAASAYIDTLIDELVALEVMTAEEAKKFTERMKKAAQDTTFTDMESNFVSALMDMEGDVKDFANDIGQTMAQKIIEQMIVPTMMQPLLDNIQKAFNDAMATNTTSDAEGNAVYNWKGVLNDEGLKASITALQDAYPELKDVVQQILSLSGVKPDFSNSLDSIGDTLLDRLLSLDDDVEDIGKQIGRTLIREMLEQMLSTGQYADRIAAIKKMWQAILTGEDTEHTIEDVLKDIEQLENDITNPENSDFSGLIAKYKSLADVAKEGFSDLRGAFLSSLIDMNGDAETFGKSIGRTMLEQMLDVYVERTYKQQIADINKEWAEALQSGNTDALERIKQKVQELYSAISTDVEVSNIADAIKELDKQLDTTFSDMADSWASALMDMEGTAEDWAQSVGKMIAEKIIKSMVIPTMIQPLLNDMQKAWNAAAEQEGATYQTMLDAMMPYLSDLVGAYEELRPIADYILNSLGVYKETVDELKEEVEYALQDMKDNFVSDLMDMEATAEKRAESISRIIAENFIKNFVLGDAFDAQMEQWQQHYESILNSGLFEDERARQLKLLRDAIASAKEGYVEQAMAIQELLGLNATNSNQTATANIADKITYEQADMGLGMLMALVMNSEQMLATVRGGVTVFNGGDAASYQAKMATANGEETGRQIESMLLGLANLNIPDGDTVREIRGLIIIGNSYLYDIKTSNEQMLRQFGERLESIDSKIGQIF